MQNWHQLLDLAQITEQERMNAAMMAAEKRRQRRTAAVRGARRLFGRFSGR